MKIFNKIKKNLETKKLDSDVNEYQKTITTDSGMWCLWDYNSYTNIDSYEKWEDLFLEDTDIIKQINLNKFVPINIHSDGRFQFKIKINTPLTEREQKYVTVKSRKYLFTTDATAVLSGIECVNVNINDNEGIKFNLSKGNYSVIIYLIDWEKEPGMKQSDGTISPNALPDFIICIEPEKDLNQNFNKSLETFDN